MVKRASTPPFDDDTTILIAYNPWPFNVNWVVKRDSARFVQWAAKVVGKDALLAFHYKSDAHKAVLVEVASTCFKLSKIIGEHSWNKFLVYPTSAERTQSTKIFPSTYDSKMSAREDGWFRVSIDESWFRTWVVDKNLVKSPYPESCWCPVPTSAELSAFRKLTRPLPKAMKPVPTPSKKRRAVMLPAATTISVASAPPAATTIPATLAGLSQPTAQATSTPTTAAPTAPSAFTDAQATSTATAAPSDLNTLPAMLSDVEDGEDRNRKGNGDGDGEEVKDEEKMPTVFAGSQLQDNCSAEVTSQFGIFDYEQQVGAISVESLPSLVAANASPISMASTLASPCVLSTSLVSSDGAEVAHLGHLHASEPRDRNVKKEKEPENCIALTDGFV